MRMFFILAMLLCVLISCKDNGTIACREKVLDETGEHYYLYHANRDCPLIKKKIWMADEDVNSFIKYINEEYCDYCIDDYLFELLESASRKNQNDYIEIVNTYFSEMTDEEYIDCKKRIERFDR